LLWHRSTVRAWQPSPQRPADDVNAFATACYILRYLGPEFVWIRTRIALARRLGLQHRRYRPNRWERIDLRQVVAPGTPTEPAAYAAFKRRQAAPFLFPLGQPPGIPEPLHPAATARRPALAERLRLLAENRCVYFFHAPAPAPIDWYANPLTGGRGNAERLWCRIPHFAAEQGDIRTLWEPGRAAWAVDLARARALGSDAPAAQLFWRWLDSWMQACPPFVGVHWQCGQEAAARLIAVALAFWSFADEATCTPERWVQFARLAWATGRRIAGHIDYAVSQKNNHAISEACGLLLVSQLFPEFRAAPRWRARGRRVLARELRRQIYSDGSYVQHSLNYQRVMLHGAILALRLAELAADPLPRDLYERLDRCGEFLFQMMDPATGQVPNYGNNDGALLLPLNECDFADFRPVVQATHYLVHRSRRLLPGPWDEDLLWLFGPAAMAAPVSAADDAPQPKRGPVPESRAFADGGYYTLRQADSWALIRCHRFRDRPGQDDNLHLDLWWRGQNVLQDCGSYQYFTPAQPELAWYFASLAAHNTLRLDRVAPYTRVSPFLWFPWPRARARAWEASDAARLYFEGESYAYDRAPWHVLHRRAVLALAGDLWLVVDDVLGEGRHEVALAWHMHDGPTEFDRQRQRVSLLTPAGPVYVAVTGHPAGRLGCELVRGRREPGRVQGLYAPGYALCLPAPTLEVTSSAALPLRLVTVISPLTPATLRMETGQEHQRITLATGAGAEHMLDLAPPARRAERILLARRAPDR